MKKIIIGVLLMIASIGMANASEVYECTSIVALKNAQGEQVGEPKRMDSIVINKENSFIMKNSGGALMSGVLAYTGEKQKDGSPMFGSVQAIGSSQVVMIRSKYMDSWAWFIVVDNGKTRTTVLTIEADCIQR